VIRQAISCDICGTEKKQTNHWFVAYDQGGELRVSGWNSRNRLRPGSKHLCGQTCLHKLVDEFMARALSTRAPQSAANDGEEETVEQAMRGDTSLTSKLAYEEVESSARLIPTPAPVVHPRPASTPRPVALPKSISAPASALPAASAQPLLQIPVELVAAAARPRAVEAVAPVVEPPRYASRNWRAAAWERERERELHSVERHPGMIARRRFNS
jgi:hypothetical protein